MKKYSCASTLFIQLSLCFAVYVFLGHPQRFLQRSSALNNGGSLDLFFISVSGGFRPFPQQTHLLKLMEKVAEAYKVGFVVSMSEFGVDDPLFHNATGFISSSKIPWYTDGYSRGEESGYFRENIKLPQGKSLDMILMNSSSQQGSSGRIKINNQMNWLTRALEESSGDWRMVVGSVPLMANQNETEQVSGILSKILIKHGVNVYLSNKECTNPTRREGVACIRVPAPIENKHGGASSNEASDIKKENGDGFLLHRVGLVDFVTYSVDLSGEVIETRKVRQQGKDVM